MHFDGTLVSIIDIFNNSSDKPWRSNSFATHVFLNTLSSLLLLLRYDFFLAGIYNTIVQIFCQPLTTLRLTELTTNVEFPVTCNVYSLYRINIGTTNKLNTVFSFMNVKRFEVLVSVANYWFKFQSWTNNFFYRYHKWKTCQWAKRLGQNY